MRYESELLRPSIFDTLKEKHPEQAEDPGARSPSRRRPPMLRPVGRSPRSTAGLVAAIVALFVAGGLGLSIFYPHPDEPPAQRPADEVSRSEPAETPIAPAAEDRPAAASPPVRPEGVGTADQVRIASLEAPAARPRPAFEEPRSAPVEPPAPPRDAPEPVEPAEPASAAEVTDSTQEDAAAEKRPAVKVFSAAPDYPEAARLAGLAGTVVVEAEIDPTGSVASTRVLRGVSPELDEAAREAVGRWRFAPATSGGRPTTDVYRTAIHFELEPPPEPETEVAALSGEDDFEPPVRLYAPPPSYPPADWVAAVEGDVVVRAAISETGKVTGVEILQGLTAGLNKAAIEALERWRFRPAMRQGEAVSSNQVLTFRFAR